MRINSPITDREYCFGQNETLVSVTDTKGHITYCNPAFLEVSGFAEAELLGQAHNIIRHPDMPSAAFFDLWATIRAGQPWTGIVKNRRKDGDFYWVQANVTPLRAGDEIAGYLSVRTQTQADSLGVTAAAVGEITSTLQGSTTAAQEGARLAAHTRMLTDSGHAAVQAAGQTMQGIAQASQGIQGIVHLIEGVAFQTNLLALNAAVEAARAGEAGRGFAVVAGEVRTLATRTAEAARNIRQLIGQSTERVSSGNDATSAALARMHETLQAVAQVDTVLGEINAAAREQQQGIEQINHAIADLDNITSQNATLVRQVHAATQALRTQADNVCRTMRLLRLEASEQSLSQRNARELRQRCRAA